MKKKQKTKADLLRELSELRSQVSKLKMIQSEHDSLMNSENAVRALLNATLDAAFLIDTEGHYLAMNETIAKRLGKTPEELFGNTAFDFIPPELAVSRKAKVNEAIQTGKPVHFIDNRLGIWLEHNVYPLFNAYGKVTKLAIYTRDITEKKHAEEALQESEEKYRNLMDNIRDEVYTLDSFGNFTFVNDMIVKRSGNSAEWFLGRNYLDVISKQDCENVKMHFDAVIGGKTQIYDLSYPTSSGDPLYVEVCTS